VEGVAELVNSTPIHQGREETEPMAWPLLSNIFSGNNMKQTLIILLSLYIGCHLHDSRNSETVDQLIEWEDQL